MRAYPLHDHDFFEIFWVEAGQIRHPINGTVALLKAGDAVMIRPADYHGFAQVPGQTAVLVNISFPVQTLRQLEERYFKGSRSFFWARDILPWTQDLAPGRLGKLTEWADELIRAPRELLYIHRFLLNVLTEFSGDQKLPAGAAGKIPPWLQRACAMAPNEMAGGVETFVRLCGRSREHVARTMRETMNTTPTEFVNSFRMGYARHHLAMSNRDILDIAMDCGLQNLSHFYTLFRRETGLTPRAYRLAASQHTPPTIVPPKKKKRKSGRK